MKEMVGDKLDPELLREKVTKAIKLGTGMIINCYYNNANVEIINQLIFPF
jgi:hypothetical protein